MQQAHLHLHRRVIRERLTICLLILQHLRIATAHQYRQPNAWRLMHLFCRQLLLAWLIPKSEWTFWALLNQKIFLPFFCWYFSSDYGITEDAVRRYLMRKPMTTIELLTKFKNKKTGVSSDKLVETMTQILKKINPVKQTIQGKMYLSIKVPKQ